MAQQYPVEVSNPRDVFGYWDTPENSMGFHASGNIEDVLAMAANLGADLNQKYVAVFENSDVETGEKYVSFGFEPNTEINPQTASAFIEEAGLYGASFIHSRGRGITGIEVALEDNDNNRKIVAMMHKILGGRGVKYEVDSRDVTSYFIGDDNREVAQQKYKEVMQGHGR